MKGREGDMESGKQSKYMELGTGQIKEKDNDSKNWRVQSSQGNQGLGWTMPWCTGEQRKATGTDCHSCMLPGIQGLGQGLPELMTSQEKVKIRIVCEILCS